MTRLTTTVMQPVEVQPGDWFSFDVTGPAAMAPFALTPVARVEVDDSRFYFVDTADRVHTVEPNWTVRVYRP